jgi:hypothetical protein
MQRWIVLGIIAMVLVVGGAVFGLRIYKENRPYPVWVPLPLPASVTVEKQDQLAKDLKAKICERSNLIKVSKDVGLVKEWALASDELCADVLARKVFVRTGDRDTPMGKEPAIHVGVNGVKKERAVSEKISMRLMMDVWNILGIKPPPTKNSY